MAAQELGPNFRLGSNIKTKKYTAGNGIAAGHLVVELNGKAHDVNTDYPLLGVALNDASANQAVIVAYSGDIKPDLTAAPEVGQTFYRHAGLNGRLCLYADLGTSAPVKVLGMGITTDTIRINPNNTGLIIP